MTHIKGQKDSDLHNEDGSHVGTARTANGRDVEQHERRIKRHLAAHEAELKSNVPAAVFSESETERRELADQYRGEVEVESATPVKPKRLVSTNDRPDTVDREAVYVWLTKEESMLVRLPRRIHVSDMWPTLVEAVSPSAKELRGEDARWLVVANGRTRKIERPAWS